MLSDKKTKAEIAKREKLFKTIETFSIKIDEYFENNAEMKNDVPDTKIVVYNKILYPIIYEISKFFYLGGGDHFFMILKDKCDLKFTGQVHYYEANASKQDIELGKSPIIPQGCIVDRNIVYLTDLNSIEIKG